MKLSARVAETHPHAHKRIDWNIIGHDVFGYRHRWFEGALHHLHLSCPAHLSLTTVELNRLGKKAQRANAVLQLPSTRELQNRLRAIVWRDTLVQLRRSSCREEIIRHLERSLRLDEGVLDEAAWYQKTGQVV